MNYAALITVDNSDEDPEAGRRGLREELAPAMRMLPGFSSCVLLTAYERGRGVGIVVFETLEQAKNLAESLTVGSTIHPGVIVTASEVMEVSASA
ncbi:MAG TPA: hypothetical protein VMU98_06410 [Acidimicrobiales bacterium]|nr:hypothetical protein [Acidimicrobiales bacterium]